MTDVSGGVRGLWYVQRDGVANVLVQLGEPYTPPPLDVIAVDSFNSGAGLLSVTFTVTQDGVPANLLGVSVALSGEDPFTAEFVDGSIISLESAVTVLGQGLTSAAGVVTVNLEGTPGAQVFFIVQTNGPTGSSLLGPLSLPV